MWAGLESDPVAMGCFHVDVYVIGDEVEMGAVCQLHQNYRDGLRQGCSDGTTGLQSWLGLRGLVCLVRAAIMVHLVKTVTIRGWASIGTVVRMSWARA